MRLHGGVQAAEIEAVVDPAKGLRREPQREAARHHSRPWQQWHAAEARPSSEQPHQPLRRSHERDDARYGGRTRGPERCSLAEAAHGASGAFQRAISPGEYVLDIDEQFGRKRTYTLSEISAVAVWVGRNLNLREEGRREDHARHHGLALSAGGRVRRGA